MPNKFGVDKYGHRYHLDDNGALCRVFTDFYGVYHNKYHCSKCDGWFNPHTVEKNSVPTRYRKWV